MRIEEAVKVLPEERNGQMKMPSKCPFMQTEGAVKLTNYTTGSQTVDTLHCLSEPIKCSGSLCKGSLMDGQSAPPGTRTEHELLDEAYSFLQQYYASIKTSSDEDIAKRYREVKEDIKSNQTYALSFEELEYGAKLAWRNASRCIGRIQWNKLHVQDCRHVTTTKEMFDALCKHVEYATNGGNIRSTITIFPQRIPGRDDFRVWNPQLINFAGYMQPDGTVIGDPGRLHFTRLCQRLGWKGKGSRFDILPWILSAPEEGPKLYEIPEELILMVNLEHPKYPWFAEMELKWYALPAVADMMLDVGGISFTACPFNGWYMATEIGARDLCDTQRYNLSEEIAKRMGLDTSRPSSLWKDYALVEATLAVIYSFQKNSVTVVDHHTASDTFIKYLNAEQKLRGGCPADWVWIVPPISGSSTKVFHQEMIVYNLKPSFEYQEKGWITYKWPKNDKVLLKYNFSTLAKIVSVSLGLISKVYSGRVPATILYASETGKSESFARKLEAILHSSFNTRVLCMEDYDSSELSKESFIVVVTSTFGSGEPPDNGRDFWSTLKSMAKTKTLLEKLKYAVFALGSRQYPNFCNFGKNVDQTLRDLGGKRIVPLEMGDELRGQEHTFNMWLPEIYKNSCHEFGIEDIEEVSPEISINTWKSGIFRLVAESSKKTDTVTDLSKLHNKSLFAVRMLSKTKLHAKHSERQTLMITLKASDASNLKYKPGDHVALFPTNPENIVNSILERIGRKEFTSSEVIRLEFLKDDKWYPFDRLPPASLRTYLRKYLDITTPPASSFLYLLSTMATNPWDKYRLKRLSEVTDDYEEWKSFRYPNLAEVLEEYPSIELDPSLLISELPLLQPRYYSISSSTLVTTDEIHLTVSLVSYRTRDNKGPVHHGVCTSYLNSEPDEEIPCFIRSSSKFHLPEDPTLPIIMVGAGSGVAPFRSFWMERSKARAQGLNLGPMYLFFGCRNSSTDYIYRDEIAQLMQEGVLANVYTAFSREPGMEKKYVQHRLEEEAELVYSAAVGGGHLYVCGDAVMATDVRLAVERIMSRENEEELISFMESRRYHEDIFSVLHRR